MNYRKLFFGIFAIVFAVSLMPYQAKAAASTPPRGWLDSCVVGWALDTNTPSKSIDVHIYVDRPAGVDNNSGLIAAITTSAVRNDVNTAYRRPIGEKHGFEWSPPDSLRDSRPHDVYVYGIDTTDTSGASNDLLDGAPKQCQWPAEIGTDTRNRIQVTSPAKDEKWQAGTTHTINWQQAVALTEPGTRPVPVSRYTIQLEPYIACLYADRFPCKIQQPAPYVIAQGVLGNSYTWNVPSDLPSRYRTISRILVSIENTDISGASEVFSVTEASGSMVIIPTAPLSATLGQSFDIGFNVSGGTSPYNSSLEGALPAGVTWRIVAQDCAQPIDGQPANCPPPIYHLAGVPTQAGSFPFTVTARDNAGQKVTTSFILIVSQPGTSALTISTSSSLSGIVNQPFSASFTVSGGTAPYQWQQTGGALPAGIHISFPAYNCIVAPCSNPYDTAIFSGTPTQVSSPSATFRVTDAAGHTAEKTFTITVIDLAPGKIIRTGYVDVATGQRVEGWGFDSTKPGACVIITYKPQTGASDNTRYTQDACPTMTRTDAEQWVRAYFGDGYAITQPLGFRADPTLVLPPGAYLVAGAKLKDSGVTLDLGESAKLPITIADTTVASGPIVITSPVRGNAWQTGQTKTITWNGSNNLPVNIKLVGQGCPSGQVCTAVLPRQYDIATGVTGSSYSWAIPTTITPGSYRISMETSAAGVDYVLWGQSGIFNVFTGTIASALFVSSPAAGETVQAGTVKEIAWNVLADAQGFPVTISYSNHPTCLDTAPACLQPIALVPITSSAPNTGSYKWQVPSTLNGQYIVTVSAGGISDDSGVFTVLPFVATDELQVTKPEKDEVWTRGTTHTIHWVPNVATGTAIISVGTYIACLHDPIHMCAVVEPPPVVIADTAPDTGSYDWAIPEDFTLQGPVSIIVTSNSSDQSGESQSFQLAGGVASNPCIDILPGQVVVGTTGTVYVITSDCKKYGFISLQDLTSRGYSLNQVERVDQAELDAIPTVEFLARAANTSFKYAGKAAVYYLTGALCKETYPSTITLRAWGVSARDIVTIPSTEQYPDCNPNFVQLPHNTWAQVSSQPTIYHIEGTVMRPYASLGALISSGFQNSKLYVIRTAEFGLYTVGDPIE